MVGIVVIWVPWDVSHLPQESYNSKTWAVYLVLDQRGLCGPTSPFLEMPSKSWSLSARQLE